MKACKDKKMKQFYRLILSLVLPLGLLMEPVCRAEDPVIVPEGTRITLQLNKNLSTRNNHEGDSFDTYVTEPVYYKDQIAIPKGSTVTGSISRITRSGRFKGKATMHLLFQSIDIPGRKKLSILASLTHINADGDEDIRTENTPERIDLTGSGVGNVVIPVPSGAEIDSSTSFSSGPETNIGISRQNVFWTRDKDLELYRGSTMEISLDQDLQIPLKK